MGPYKKFPFIIYHTGQGAKQVMSEDELTQAHDEGWSDTPIQMTEEGRIKARIEWHEEQVGNLKRKLAEVKRTNKKVA